MKARLAVPTCNVGTQEEERGSQVQPQSGQLSDLLKSCLQIKNKNGLKILAQSEGSPLMLTIPTLQFALQYI